MYTVYKITNAENDRVYVGHTGQPLDARWSCHKSYAKYGYGRSELYEEMRRIGIERFKIEPIAIAENVKEACKIEEQHMLRLGSIDHGYNHNRPTHLRNDRDAILKDRIGRLRGAMIGVAIVLVWNFLIV
jgi:hypothetical protein